MEDEDATNAISEQLSELQGIVRWVIGFGFVATVLATQGNDPIDVLGISLARSRAFMVISVLYVAACAATLAHIRRLVELLLVLPPSKLKLGYSKLEAHPWLLNPFVTSEIGFQGANRGSLALFTLVIIYWMCIAGIYVLLPPNRGVVDSLSWEFADFVAVQLRLVPLGLMSVLGYFSLLSVRNAMETAVQRMPDVDRALRMRLSAHRKSLEIAAQSGVGAGGVLLLVVLILHGEHI